MIITYFNASATLFPQIPLDAYRLCIMTRYRTLEITVVTVSLAYGMKQLPVFRLTGALIIP